MNTTIISTSVFSAMNGASVSNRVNAQRFDDQQPHMTSLEIAELAGKPHNDVMKAIRKMEPAWEKIAQGNFSLGSYRDANNQVRPCYDLTKRECMFIATKFNDEARARLVLRWEQLEMERLAKQPMKLLTTAQDRTIYYYSLEGKIMRKTYLVWTERGR